MSWRIKGVVYEACAAEGHCPLWLGRDTSSPCTSFMVLQIDEGHIDGVAIDGTIVVFLADLSSNKFGEVMAMGGEGGIYISDGASDAQRKVLEPFLSNNVPGTFLVRNVLAVKYAKMDLKKEGKMIHFTMPFGGLKMSLTTGADGNPVRLENTFMSAILPELNVCDTHHWDFHDLGKDFDFSGRSGIMFPYEREG
jgi:hypothetical protein